MSTATITPERPLRPVWTPQDAHEVHQALRVEKSRWGAFLSARDVLLGYGRKASTGTVELLERLHLGAVVQLARRSLGWLLGAATAVRRTARAAGIRPAIAWLLTTSFGQAGVRRIVLPVARVTAKVLGWALDATGWTLRLFGKPGNGFADKLDGVRSRTSAAVTTRVRTLAVVSKVLVDPAGLPMQAVGTVAKARLLNALVRSLPTPWRFLVRVLANVAVLPGWVRRDALHLVVVAATAPSQDPTPPASPAAARPDAGRPVSAVNTAVSTVTSEQRVETAEVIDLAEERAKLDDLLDPGALEAIGEVPFQAPARADGTGSYQRYPAKRSTAKRKR